MPPPLPGVVVSLDDGWPRSTYGQIDRLAGLALGGDRHFTVDAMESLSQGLGEALNCRVSWHHDAGGRITVEIHSASERIGAEINDAIRRHLPAGLALEVIVYPEREEQMVYGIGRSPIGMTRGYSAGPVVRAWSGQECRHQGEGEARAEEPLRA